MEKALTLTLGDGRTVYVRCAEIVYAVKASPAETKAAGGEVTKISLTNGEHWFVKEPPDHIMNFANV